MPNSMQCEAKWWMTAYECFVMKNRISHSTAAFISNILALIQFLVSSAINSKMLQYSRSVSLSLSLWLCDMMGIAMRARANRDVRAVRSSPRGLFMQFLSIVIKFGFCKVVARTNEFFSCKVAKVAPISCHDKIRDQLAHLKLCKPQPRAILPIRCQMPISTNEIIKSKALLIRHRRICPE